MSESEHDEPETVLERIDDRDAQIADLEGQVRALHRARQFALDRIGELEDRVEELESRAEAVEGADE